jgi:hypothetical protein
MIERTRKIAGSCDNGPCPDIRETNSPWIAVRGYIPTPEELAAMGLPEGETVVFVDRATMDGWAPRP